MNYLKSEERFDDICDLLQAIIDTSTVILSTQPNPQKFTIELSYEKNNNIYVPELYNITTVERYPTGAIGIKKHDMSYE